MEDKEIEKLRRLKKRNWVAKHSPHKYKKHAPKTAYKRVNSSQVTHEYKR
jgi:hypothetical protein